MKPAPSLKAKAPKHSYIAEIALKAGEEVVFANKATPEQTRAAAAYLLENMPPVARKGQKTASQILAEIREE